ncbi:MAG: class I SAM-dependent methyltransferase [Acidobacteriota bacterium]
MPLHKFTRYELMRRGLEPLLPPLYKTVRKKLMIEASGRPSPCMILDVGGRKSPYTIGVPGRITVIDLPRQSEVQNALNLGITDAIAGEVTERRSNIDAFIFGDMTKSDIPDDSYDVIVSVEVLEHVEEDELFLDQVRRVLKPGGCFLMTTPNGDYVANKNPDHKRHYKRTQLAALLEDRFGSVNVEYAIAGGTYRKLGLKSWSLRKPITTAMSAFGNIVNSIQSSNPSLSSSAVGTHHLIAVARKPETRSSRCAE